MGEGKGEGEEKTFWRKGGCNPSLEGGSGVPLPQHLLSLDGRG